MKKEHTFTDEPCEACKETEGEDHNMYRLVDLIRWNEIGIIGGVTLLGYFWGGFWMGLVAFIFMMVLNATNR